MNTWHRSLRTIAAGLSCLALLLMQAGCSSTSSSTDTTASTASASGTDDGTNPLQLSGDDFPITITDFSDETLSFDEAPQRVCLLAGTVLNLWYDVGGTAVCTTTITENLRVVPEHESEMRAVPTVGNTSSINIEAVTSYNPDLVIAMGGAQDSTLSRLRELGMQAMLVKVRSQAELFSVYRAFGALTGNADIAEQRISHIEDQVSQVTAQLPDQPASVVIVYVTSRSLAVKLDNSIAGQIATTLKINNIASGLTPDNPESETTPLDIEEIVRQQPDYVMVTSMVSSNDIAKERINEEFSTNQAWQAVDAVRDDKVVYLPQQYFLLNGGPYYGDAVEYMAASVYPDIYGEPEELS